MLAHIVVQLRIPHHFRLEPRKSSESHPRESTYACHDLQPDLVLEEPRMPHHLVVEDEVVGKRGEDEVEEDNADERQNG